MHARITRVRILPGKRQQFTADVESLMPALRGQRGYRNALVLRGGEDDRPEATLISVWDSLEDLRASEANMYYYEVLARLFSSCEGYPIMHEEEVLLSECSTG